MRKMLGTSVWVALLLGSAGGQAAQVCHGPVYAPQPQVRGFDIRVMQHELPVSRSTAHYMEEFFRASRPSSKLKVTPTACGFHYEGDLVTEAQVSRSYESLSYAQFIVIPTMDRKGWKVAEISDHATLIGFYHAPFKDKASAKRLADAMNREISAQ